MGQVISNAKNEIHENEIHEEEIHENEVHDDYGFVDDYVKYRLAKKEYNRKFRQMEDFIYQRFPSLQVLKTCPVYYFIMHMFVNIDPKVTGAFLDNIFATGIRGMTTREIDEKIPIIWYSFRGFPNRAYELKPVLKYILSLMLNKKYKIEIIDLYEIHCDGELLSTKHFKSFYLALFWLSILQVYKEKTDLETFLETASFIHELINRESILEGCLKDAIEEIVKKQMAEAKE